MLGKKKLILLLLLFSISSSGCALLLAGAVGGAGTAAWLSDKLSQEVDASFDKSIDAVTQAMASLKLDVTKKTVKDDVAQIKGTYIDGRMIWIDVRPLTSTTSRIDVRVGAFGDEIASRRILDSVLKHL